MFIKTLTKKQKEAMKPYADKWIEIGLRTGETDWDTFDKYMPICYEKAGIKYPKNVVRVLSPLVGGLAAAVAEGIWRKKRVAVGGAVGGAVDEAVDEAVTTAITIAKKASIVLSWHYWLGGQFWVGYNLYWGVASVNFFFDICKLKLVKDIMERAEAYRKVCESVNYIWPNRDFVMVCARPIKIERNASGRLHSITGKAIEYPDGWGLYSINGVKFDEKLWKEVVSGKISAQQVFKIENTEQRRIAYELMDKAKMKDLAGYKVLDEVKDDGCGYPMKIVNFTVKGFDEPFYYLNCFCPSSGREYFIETQKQNCLEAKMSSFGLEETIKFDKEY